MERLQELITQLKEQFERHADPSQMLLTTRLLEAELSKLSAQVVPGRVSAKVAVMMPSSMKMYAGQPAEVKSVPEVKSFPVEAKNYMPEVKAVSSGSVPELKAAPAAIPEFRPTPVAPAAPAYRNNPDPGMVPEQRNGRSGRELNDVIGSNGSSLNDKLKGDVMELAATLNDSPVRDLKKAIGVNDRYVFISQLFRGDEVMYERSIKTINGFRILPEAEYWMERELKVKLGWDENREATRHFYQLVKRRFT